MAVVEQVLAATPALAAEQLGVLCAAFAPGAAFLCTVPALFATVGAIVALVVDNPLWSLCAVAAGLAVATALLPYFGYMVFVALGLALGGAGSLFVVLFGLFVLPVVELFLPDRVGRVAALAVPATAVLTAVAFTAAGLVVDQRDAEHPAPTHLAYVLDTDTDTGRAHWVSAEADPTPWTGRYVVGDDTSGLPPGFQDRDLLTGPARPIAVAAPEAELVSRDGDTLTVRVTSRRGAPNVTVRLSEPITKATADVADRGEPVTVPVAGTRADTWPGEIRFRDLPPGGVELTVRTAAEVRLTVFDESRGLADVPEFEPRPADLVAGPQHDGDGVYAARTYEF